VYYKLIINKYNQINETNTKLRWGTGGQPTFL